MDVFGQFIDGRIEAEKAEAQARAQSGRSAATDRATLEWLNGNKAPEIRLLSFDTWLRRELDLHLVWPADDAKKQRQIEQCRIHLEGLVLGLWKRGWYLDGKALAAHLQTVLQNIGKYQRTGKVQDHWAYFKSAVDRYVGANSEEIRAEAMRAGAHVGQLMSALGVSKGSVDTKTLPELIAQRRAEIADETNIREKLASARRTNKEDSSQMKLL